MAAQSKLKHREIYEHIHRGIINGQFAVGKRIPTEAELVQQFGVARVTVQRALRDLEHEGLLVRRRGSGTFVSDHQSETSQLLGLISPDAPGVFSTIADSLARYAHQNGMGLLLGRQISLESPQLKQDVEDLCEQFTQRRIAGVFLAPIGTTPSVSPLNSRITEALERARIPIVLLDRDLHDFPRRSNYDLVGVDNVNVGFVLTQHLLQLGYQRIAFPRVIDGLSTITARITGYRQALQAQGITPPPEWTPLGDNTDSEFVRKLLKDSKIQAIVCANDHEAAKLMRTLAGLSVRVPEDAAVVGVDDDRWATFLSVSLTTMRQPCDEIASVAIRVMLDRIAHPSMLAREACLPCTLIVRESCGSKQRSVDKKSKEPAHQSK